MKKRNKLLQAGGLPLLGLKTPFILRRNSQYMVNYHGDYLLKFIGYSCLISYWYGGIGIYEKKK